MTDECSEVILMEFCIDEAQHYSTFRACIACHRVSWQSCDLDTGHRRRGIYWESLERKGADGYAISRN